MEKRERESLETHVNLSVFHYLVSGHVKSLVKELLLVHVLLLLLFTDFGSK